MDEAERTLLFDVERTYTISYIHLLVGSSHFAFTRITYWGGLMAFHILLVSAVLGCVSAGVVAVWKM
jgi:hypothetical protein